MSKKADTTPKIPPTNGASWGAWFSEELAYFGLSEKNLYHYAWESACIMAFVALTSQVALVGTLRGTLAGATGTFMVPNFLTFFFALFLAEKLRVALGLSFDPKPKV